MRPPGRVSIATIASVLWGVAIAVSVGGCLRDNPNHCANAGGDAHCVELQGPQSFCSRCTTENAGCGSTRPSDSCHVEADSSAEAGEETVGSESEGGSESDTSVEVDCGGSGLDPTCPETMPYCVDGTCTPCSSAGGSSFCQGLDADEPICLQAAGQCVACVPDQREHCPHTQPFCNESFTCSGCTEHADCPESACDIERGTCFATSRVFWVSNDNPCPGNGTQADPYCEIKSALDEVRSPDFADFELHSEGVIKIVRTSTPYTEAVLLSTAQDKRIALIGVGSPAPMIRDTSEAVRVGNHRLYLSNLSLSHNEVAGLRSQNRGRVWADDVTFTGNPTAIEVLSNARVGLRRVRVVGNDGDAVMLTGEARLSAVSSVIGNNGNEGADTVALRVDGGARFDLLYTTVANNRGLGAAAIRCVDAGSSSLRNTIVVGPGLGSIQCADAVYSNSYLDSAVPGEGVTVATSYDAAWFVNVGNGIFRPAPSHPFGDVAVWQLGDPLYDLAGAVRAWVPGRPDVAGALLP